MFQLEKAITFSDRKIVAIILFGKEIGKMDSERGNAPLADFLAVLALEVEIKVLEGPAPRGVGERRVGNKVPDVPQRLAAHRAHRLHG